MKQGFIFMALLVSIYGYSQTTPLFKTGNTVLKSIAVSPDGRTVAIEGESSEVALWDLGARKKVMTLKRDQVKLDQDQTDMSAVVAMGLGTSSKLFFTPNGQRIFLSHSVGLAVWNPKVEKSMIEFFAAPDFFDVTQSGEHIAVIKEATIRPLFIPADIKHDLFDDIIVLYSSKTGETKELSISTPSEIKRIRFVPGSTNLIISGVNGDLSLLNYLTGEVTELPPLFQDEYKTSSFSYNLEDKRGFTPNNTIAIQPNQETIAVMDSKSIVHIFDFKNNRLKSLIKLNNNADPKEYLSVERLEFTPSGKLLLSIIQLMSDKGVRKQVSFWEVETGKQVKTIPTGPGFFSLNFNLVGNNFALSKMDASKSPPFFISIIDGETFQEIESIQGQGISAFFPNDPKRIVYLLNSGIGVHSIK